MTEDSPMHKVESAALAFRFISAHQNRSPDSTPNKGHDFSAKKLYSSHSVAMRQRRNAHLNRQSRNASESFIKCEDFFGDSFRLTHEHGSCRAAQGIVVRTSHRPPAALPSNLSERLIIAREQLIAMPTSQKEYMLRIGAIVSSEASGLICANGAGIPCIGFGTFGMHGANLKSLLVHAIRAGFRHIDTAQIYGNEDAVGEGVRTSGISRNDVFITTKVWVENYTQTRFQRSVDVSLKALHTDYIDLLLLYWPSNVVPPEDQIAWLNALVLAGKVLSIGVSNFNRALLQAAVDLSDLPLATNQFEYHPYLNQASLVTATRETGAAVTAYYAMAVGRVVSEPVLQGIAKRHSKSVSQSF
jgi:2,5-diketo-D-gluconate reductase B